MIQQIHGFSSVKLGNQVEALDDQTLPVNQEINSMVEENENDLMMSRFFDFLTDQSLTNPETLIPYTEEMSTELDELLADVVIDE